MGSRSWRKWRTGVVGNLRQEGKIDGGQTEGDSGKSTVIRDERARERKSGNLK